MAGVKCFSSVTIRDQADTGSLLCYLTSNHPSSVVYNPTQNTYTPNWASSNLVLTPVVQYNGTSLQLNATGLVVTYRKMEGSSTATLSSNEIVSGGVLTVSANRLASIPSGQLTYICKITYTNPDVGLPIENECQMTFTLLSQASDAGLLQIYSQDGGVIRNSSGSTTLSIRFTCGGSEVTPTSIQWAKFANGVYSDISGKTGVNLVVTDSMVDDFAFFRATVSYNNKSYVAFYSVDDIQDPISCVVLSTVQQFKNNEGWGVVYSRLYQANEELDPIKSTTFSNVAPSVASSGDYYYHVDLSNKTVTLKKYNGSAWVDANEPDVYNYAYYRTDTNGTVLDTSTPYKTDRCIYVDPSIINNRMIFMCEVSD